MTEVNHRGADQSGVRTSADRHHGPGCLGAGNQWQRDRIGLPGTMLQIDVVNPDPLVAHDHLARRRHRVRTLDRHAATLVVLAVPDFEREARAVVAAFAAEGVCTETGPPPGFDGDWLGPDDEL